MRRPGFYQNTFLVTLFLTAFLFSPTLSHGGYADVCKPENTLTPQKEAANFGKDKEITGTVCVEAGDYNYLNVNIYSADGKTEAKLIFQDANINFWAKSILVENKGSLIAGAPAEPIKNKIIFHLYGDEKSPAITCKKDNCGVPDELWVRGHEKKGGEAKDYFYQYHNLPTYAAEGDDHFFGVKTIAVAYGGTIQLFGKKGATYYDKLDITRFAKVKNAVKRGDARLDLDRFVDWKPGDKILLLTKNVSSLLSEIHTIQKIEFDKQDQHGIITIEGSGVVHTNANGAEMQVVDFDPSGTSWARLNKTVAAGDLQIRLDRVVDWRSGDQIAITTTDYLPGHSEMHIVDSVITNDKENAGNTTINIIKQNDDGTTGMKWSHNGEKYSLAKHKIPDRLKDEGFAFDAMETRAAVALLSRNIRIVSEKCKDYAAASCQGMPEEAGTYFGGHTIVRQGVKQYQVQGVEFYQMGQGGRMAQSPVNFFMVRQAPAETFVRDCSINESMNHWVEIRGTQNVLLERNVGWKSIGHGFYLADGTEANNTLRANIGIYARPAVGIYGKDGKLADFRDNPRRVPGVLAKTNPLTFNDYDSVLDKDNLWYKNYPKGHKFCADIGEPMQLASDYAHPAVFHIMNSYNDFEYNMAAGAGTCGACYWLVPANASGPSLNQTWEGYANIQKMSTTDGLAPIKAFKGNFCSTAMYSLLTVGGTGACNGLSTCSADDSPDKDIRNEDIYKFIPIKNEFAESYEKLALYPKVKESNYLKPTRCGADNCVDGGAQPFKSCIKGQTEDCVLSVIDSYTSSFHWANTNFGAVWLRGNWFLITDLALSDVLSGGLTSVSGGSYDQVINGYWALTRRSLFVGHTQQWDMKNEKDQPLGNPLASNVGAFNKYSKMICEDMLDPKLKSHLVPAAICLSRGEGISIPTDNFLNYQRLYNIYDGPVYQEANAYVHIKKTPVNCSKGDAGWPEGQCFRSQYMYGGDLARGMGIPRAQDDPFKGSCVLPNAAIGWKQPNGFYYPPAFHSRNLFFDDVDIRHYVIVPLFTPGTTDVDVGEVKSRYCTFDVGAPANLFAGNFTDVDRQTELSDDDGSLSGLAGADPKQNDVDKYGGTISVNNDSFFEVPNETMECLSEQSCFQVPYNYVSAVVYPNAVPVKGDTDAVAYCNANSWCDDCQDRNCYGVPIYRQLLRDGETKNEKQSIRMMGAGIFQRSTLVSNKGIYYIDTTVSDATQRDKGKYKASVFEKNKVYNVFLLYARPATRVTFQLYVGDKFDIDKDITMVRAGSKGVDETIKGKKDIVLTGDFSRESPIEFTAKTWPAQWQKHYANGILSVTMDMSDAEIAADFLTARQETCKPSTFCKWQVDAQDKTKGKCVYDTAQEIIDYEGDDSVCGWSVKAQECPSGGCPGFQIKLADDFKTDSVAGKYRPDPAYYTNVADYYKGLKYTTGWSFDTDWKLNWKMADPDREGNDPACVYKSQPPVPNIK